MTVEEIKSAVDRAGGKCTLVYWTGGDEEWPEYDIKFGQYSAWSETLEDDDYQRVRKMMRNRQLSEIDYGNIDIWANPYYTDVYFEVAIPGCEYFVLNDRGVAHQIEG